MSRMRRRRLPGSVPLCCVVLLCVASRHGRAGAEWTDGRICGPFLCRAEFPLAPVKGLLAELAQLQAELVRQLGVPPARQPIEIFLFRDESSYRRHLKRHLPEVPYRRALYVKGRGPGRVLAYRHARLPVDLRHECTHALLHAVLPVVPLWLDEGLAEYFEVPASRRAFDNPHLGALRWNLRLGMVPRMEGLEKRRSLSEMGCSDYRAAWAWVHFMLHGPPEAHEELVRYLADLHASAPPGLLSQRLRRRLPNTQQHLVAHFKTWER